jgi:hypothetical protein
MAKGMSNETFPIYHLSYMNIVSSINDAVVSAESAPKAKSLLETYLREHPVNPEYPEVFMPREQAFKCELLAHKADREGVIYSSQDRR